MRTRTNCAICNTILPAYVTGVLCPACLASDRSKAKPRIPSKNQYKTKPEQPRTKFTATRHGYTIEQQRILYGQQQGRCAICSRALFLVLDHNHITRKVRGFLCRGCNTKLAGLDDAEFMGRARDYLDNPPANKL